MRLQATVGYLRDERTLAFYNLASGSQIRLLQKQRAGRRQVLSFAWKSSVAGVGGLRKREF